MFKKITTKAIALLMCFFVCFGLLDFTSRAAVGDNSVSFTVTRVVAANSASDRVRYLNQTIAGGNLSGVLKPYWSGFRIDLSYLYVSWQALGYLNIAAPCLMQVTFKVSDSYALRDGDVLLMTERPAGPITPFATGDYAAPYAGTGLYFANGQSIGAYHIDVNWSGSTGYYTMYFAIDDQTAADNAFTLSLGFYNPTGGTVAYGAIVTVTDISCVDTTSAIIAALNSVAGAGENEKAEAEAAGSSSVSSGQDSVPNSSDTLLDGVGSFVSGLSYNGTACVWTMPNVYIPAIPGIMDRVDLIQEQPINFATYVNMLPDNVLLIIRVICSVALIIFAFKELYGLIEYVLTLRGDK